MRWIGGNPINWDSEHDVVDQTATQSREAEKLVVAIGHSGTRKKKDCWKSGFYCIAHTAQVPILCGYLDYGQKKACLGLSFVPTGDIKEDMDRIREFYQGIQGKYPELTTRIRIVDE